MYSVAEISTPKLMSYSSHVALISQSGQRDAQLTELTSQQQLQLTTVSGNSGYMLPLFLFGVWLDSWPIISYRTTKYV